MAHVVSPTYTCIIFREVVSHTCTTIPVSLCPALDLSNGLSLIESACRGSWSSSEMQVTFYTENITAGI